MKKLDNIKFRKAMIPRERYSRELHRYYKSLAVRVRRGERVDNMERFLESLRELVNERQAESRKLGKVAS